MVKKKTIHTDFSKIGKNISALMETCGIDASELSKQTGLPCSTISRLRSNTTEFSPNLNSLLPITDYFHITLSQLIGEEPLNHIIYGKFNPSKIKKLPLPVLNNQNIINYLETKDTNKISFLSVDIYVNDGSFAYYLQGNAMEPQFPDKTLLIIDPQLETENLDYVLVIETGKKSPIFRQILIEGEEQYLRTLNPSFNEFTKLNKDRHTILGVMVQSRRNFRDIEIPLQNNFKEKVS